MRRDCRRVKDFGSRGVGKLDRTCGRSEPRGIAGLESVHLDVATPSDPDQSTWSRGGSGERNVRLIPAEEPVDILRRTMG